MTADKFVKLPIPPRTWLLHKAMPHPSIGMISAWRGDGKTYTALSLAIALANGDKEWMGYKIPEQRYVLYIDGEMPKADLIERIKNLSRGKAPSRLRILASEDMAMKHHHMDLGIHEHREELISDINAMANEQGEPFGLIILDNWTSLISSIDENDNSKLTPIKQWLIKLRHGEQGVLLIHHHGKGRGGQRGASAREDILDYSAVIETVVNRKKLPDGRFRFRWDKTRTGRPNPDYFFMELKEGCLIRIKDRSSVAKGKGNCDKVLKAMPGTFTELVERTGLHGQSMTNALKALDKIGQAKLVGKIYQRVD